MFPRACARESCNKGNVAVARPPLDVEPLANFAVDFRFGCASIQHPRHKTASVVNFRLCAFVVWHALAGADHGWFGGFHLMIKTETNMASNHAIRCLCQKLFRFLESLFSSIKMLSLEWKRIRFRFRFPLFPVSTV